MSARPHRTLTVMSVLRFLVWVVIAGALIKLAFFPAVSADETDGLEPGGVYGELTVFPETGTHILRETRYLSPGVTGETVIFSHEATAWPRPERL